MNYTIHLTENCNLRCKYCYEKRYYDKQNNEIDFEYVKSIIDREARNEKDKCVITFYGGEPLLKKELIYKTVEFANELNMKNKFYFSMTTNGTLLDEKFLEYINCNSFINISYSIDGFEKIHNLNRIYENGTGSFELVKSNAIRLLNSFSNVVAMMVVTKNNIDYLSESIKYLYDLGFRKFNTLFDYSSTWDDEDLPIIKRELEKMALFYFETFMSKTEISIPILDEKIKTHINGKYDCNEDCLMDSKSVNVGVDGKYYFCMQFVYNDEYVIGDCKNGIDNNKRLYLLKKMGIENEVCKECAIRTRCKHRCPCKNYILTNDVNGLSPFVCEFERMNIEIADKLAEKLYENKNEQFIVKFYDR